jgi:DNA-binding TFAR19-related protein (PDSD5 family)
LLLTQSYHQNHFFLQLVKKERASAVEALIASMALQGKIDSKITEGKLIEMLEGIVGAQQKKAADAGKISIQRKKYNLDSDDEDDNDDDLL